MSKTKRKAHPGSGRPKGSKNKKTVSKLAAGTAVIAFTAPVAKGGAIKAQVIDKAKKGISPKDLLLHTMREAWAAYYRLMAEAGQCKAEAEGMGSNHEAYAALVERCSTLKVAADMQLELATDLAVKAAPYEHAKLANIDGKIRGNVLIELQKF